MSIKYRPLISGSKFSGQASSSYGKQTHLSPEYWQVTKQSNGEVIPNNRTGSGIDITIDEDGNTQNFNGNAAYWTEHATFVSEYTNEEADIFVTYSFPGPRPLTRIVFDRFANFGAKDFIIELSIDGGTTYETVTTLSDDTDSTDLDLDLLSLGNQNDDAYNLKYFTHFRINCKDTDADGDGSNNTFHDDDYFRVQHVWFWEYGVQVTTDYNVEFDDALLDLSGWKNPRFEGSKLIGASINEYTDNWIQNSYIDSLTATGSDISYGRNPVVENKISALFVGNTIVGEGEQDNLTNIFKHSFIEIDKILLINHESNEVNLINRATEENDFAFNRFITTNFAEGSSFNFKLLDFSIQTALKQRYFSKFNKGYLMKIYTYQPDTGSGYNDGVFGGYGVNVQPTDCNQLSHSGLFGYGQASESTAAGIIISNSLFLSSSEETTPGIYSQRPFPIELKDYKGSQVIHNFTERLSATPLNISDRSSYIPPTITLNKFMNSWVFLDIVRGNNNYFVTFEKGRYSLQNNKQESIATMEIYAPEVNPPGGYNLDGPVWNNFLEPIEKTGGVNSNDLKQGYIGVTGVTNIRGIRYFQSEIPSGSGTDGLAETAEPKIVNTLNGLELDAGDILVSGAYSASYWYPFSQYQFSVLRQSPTIIGDIDKETELYDGVGEKGFVLIPTLTHRKVKDNLEYYLEKAGLIEKTTETLSPPRGT